MNRSLYRFCICSWNNSGIRPRKSIGVFLFINNLRLLFSKGAVCFWLYTLMYLGTAKLSGKAKVSTNLFRCLKLVSQKMGHAVTQSTIKIFSKCVKENNLLLLSPSGGNCCLGGLRYALMLKVPVLDTDSGFKHSYACAYGFFFLFFFPPSFILKLFHTGS